MSAVAPIAHAGDEAEIHALVAAGDRRGALAQVAAQMGRDLGEFSMAMLGNQKAARDVCDAVLAACHAQLDGLAGQRLRPWLFGRVLSECQRRSYARHAQRDDTLAFALAGARQSASRTRALLDRIPRGQREAALLRYIGRLNYSDIANLCGCSAEQAEKRVGRALLSLRQELQGDPHGHDSEQPERKGA